MIETRFCQHCGALYTGGVLSRFCAKCKKERQRLQSAKWLKEHREWAKLYRQRKYEKGPIPQKEPEQFYKTDEQKYCANYRADELSCIQCYENQTAAYKGCYKK